MPIAFPALCQGCWFAGSSATRWRAWSVLSAAKKNSLWNLWWLAPELLRSKASGGARPSLWRLGNILGVGGAPGGLSTVWQSETRAPGLAGRQSLLHQTLCLLCRSPVSRFHDQGCCPGSSSGLGFGQGTGEAIHARTVAPGGDARPQSDR